MVVDHEAMRVAHLLVAVPGRAVVGPDELRCVKVVITRPVRMLHFVVLVFEFFGIFAWPERHRGDHTKYGKDRQDELALRFGVNLMMYALTGNYKADQVHVPYILERLGE